MPTFIVDIEETRSYGMRVEADSKQAAQDAVWEPLEEVNPDEIGAELLTAYIDSVCARELYDHEKETTTA
jgi:hypothetical protein